VSPVAPFQQYIDPRADWSAIQRVVLLPLSNHTAYPRIAEELQSSLAAELQRAGRFDMVVATREDPGARSRDIFSSGQFDEIELLRIAREYQAQAVLVGHVTQYHPYHLPRIGLSLLMIYPAEGIAIASSEGMWDAREAETAAQAKQQYGSSLHWPHSVIGADRVLESPDLFQRFVSQQIASALVPPNAHDPTALPAVIGGEGSVIPASHTSSTSNVPSSGPAHSAYADRPPELPNNRQP
jgi:nucleotide-binding universal stress UspA family protein